MDTYNKLIDKVDRLSFDDLRSLLNNLQASEIFSLKAWIVFRQTEISDTCEEVGKISMINLVIK